MRDAVSLQELSQEEREKYLEATDYNEPIKKELIDNSWKSYPKNLSDMIEYQNWFDKCDSIDSCIRKGIIDFHTRILPYPSYSVLGDPRDKVSLEIGYGGGRLISAASQIFNTAIGIDILQEDSVKMTREFLEISGAKNFKLMDYSQIDEIKDSSIDFIYSFIVFQHFSTIDYFHTYMKLIKRTLKPGGMGTIFFGIPTSASPEFMEFIIEKGYRHWHDDFQHGDCVSTLYFDPNWAERQIREVYNFTPIQVDRWTKQPWSSGENLSSQFFITFKNGEI
jgi:ubiquinone/menaquinone biosynthesis C-methylase UbiE